MTRMRARCAKFILSFVISAGLAAQSADAASVRVERVERAAGPVGELVYLAALGDADRVTIDSEVGDGAVTAYLVRARASTIAGSGCLPTPDPELLRCPLPAGTAPAGPRVILRDGNDRVIIAKAIARGSVLSGGRGRDRLSGGGRLIGGPGADTLTVVTDEGARLEAGHGADHVIGGPGGDMIDAGLGGDQIETGPGRDRIRASDGGRDTVLCGDGEDVARVDGLDLVGPLLRFAEPGGRCEHLLRSSPPRALDSFCFVAEVEGLVCDISCPPDFREVCRTKVTVSRLSGSGHGTRRLRVAPGHFEVAIFDVPTLGPFLLERKLTVITYPRGRDPRVAVRILRIEISGPD